MGGMPGRPIGVVKTCDVGIVKFRLGSANPPFGGLTAHGGGGCDAGIDGGMNIDGMDAGWPALCGGRGNAGTCELRLSPGSGCGGRLAGVGRAGN